MDAWQYASITITPSTKRTVETIKITCCYERNTGTAYFDNISLVCAVAESTEYDDNGKPLSSAITGINGQTTTYDDNNNVKKIVTKTGTGSSDKITQTFTYDSTFVHRLVSSTDGTTTQTLTHDAFGNVTSTTLKSAKTAGKEITSSSTYSTDGNRVTSTTSGNGQTTTYTYGTNFSVKAGVPTVVTDTNGNQTLTTYDAMGRVTQNTFANDGTLQYTYTNNQLSAVTRGDGQTVSFDYDAFGNSTEISIGSLSLASYLYGANNGMLLSQTYGNGDSVSFTYDILGRNKTTTYFDDNGDVERIMTYGYTGDGQLYSIDDSKTGYRYEYTYDFNGRIIASSVSQGQTILLQTRQTYNANSQLTKQTWQMGSTSYSEIYTYNKTTGSVATVTTGNGHQLTMVYDSLQRLSKVESPVLDRNYTYRDISDTKTTTQVTSLWYGDTQSAAPFSYSYTYDALGNIASYTDSNGTISYTYDDMGQLLTATGAGQNYTYTYDDYGNFLTSSNGATTHTYTYLNSAWKDMLSVVDGISIYYNSHGDPTSYYNGNSYTFEWAEGRRLVGAVTGDSTISYVYDMNGLRTSKVTADATSTYYYAGGKLFREVRGTDTLDFFYDQSGTPYALTYNGTTYYYILNLQGDVMAMVDASNNVVASYTYSPYGEVLTATGTMAEINPLRYRGYYYDTETCLYYLQSRYYDPVLGRFLNADSYASTGQGLLGFNMFAYCGNNPVNNIDPDGQTFVDLTTIVLNTIANIFVNIRETTMMFVELTLMGFDDITFQSARECLETLRKHGIDTANEKAHFFAQCYIEGGLSILEAGYLSEERAEAYRRKRPYYPYYGAGYIQLTWDYNYKKFSEYMNDPMIYELGPKYVAENYAWGVAGWFWSNKNINNLIATGGTVRDVTRIVNGGYNALAERERAYYRFLELFGG